jgi:hypothetical protein
MPEYIAGSWSSSVKNRNASSTGPARAKKANKALTERDTGGQAEAVRAYNSATAEIVVTPISNCLNLCAAVRSAGWGFSNWTSLLKGQSFRAPRDKGNITEWQESRRR